MSWPFDLYSPPEDVDEDALAGLYDELRAFLAAVASSAPDRASTHGLTADLRAWRQRLARFATDDAGAPYGQLGSVDDHGLASLPVMTYDVESPGSVDATVTFSRWHLGGGGTVHGGQVATALDAVMGHSQLVGGWIARTAYLNVSYLAGTPFDRLLQLTVRTTSTEGRKHFLHGRLHDGTTTLAEAEALFVRVARYPGALENRTATCG